jgi:transcriptional regulator with XRE-family HTH domain
MATSSTTPFGGLLRQHRVAAGLTQEALAERAGMSVYGIQKLEAGTTQPYRDTAQRLARALGLTAETAEQFQAAVAPVRRHGSAPRASTSDEPHHNLPSSVTTFVGREQELIDIPARLQGARLMTLTGVGGSGKTRLAIEVARRVVDKYPEGVWLVELAQVTDAALVPHRVAAAVGVRETADQSISDALADALRSTQVLLVLDNCEHLLDPCAALVDLLLRECPELQILATSREPLGIPGEVSWAVLPLSAPDAEASSSIFGGVVVLLQGDVARSRELLETSVALWRTVDDHVGLAIALYGLGRNQACTREFEQAESALTESRDLARGSGSTFAICVALNGSGDLARHLGQAERATTILRESLVLGRTLERAADRGNAVGRALVLLGRALSEQGHVDEAMVVLKEALRELRGSGMAGWTLAQALEWIAPVVATTGDPLRAARLFGAADASWRASGATRYRARRSGV